MAELNITYEDGAEFFTTTYRGSTVTATLAFLTCGKNIVELMSKKHDPVNNPKHYNSHPSGIECIEITRHMNFNLGNAFKYLWRTDHKNGIEDLKKAIWYINDEIARLENAKNK